MDNQKLHDIWNVELSLLEKLKIICQKYNLKYCASSGTLLGAARHKGFIPWDDDIDVFLPWNDYKILLEVAPKECNYPFFFQSFLTEKDGEASASRLRRSDTTGVTKWEYDNVGPDYDKGIFIDIFPLFFVPDNEQDRIIQKESIMYFWKCIRGHDAISQKNRGKIPNSEYEKYISYYLCVKDSMTIEEIKWSYLNSCAMGNSPSKTLGATSSRVHLDTLMWDASLYNDYIDLPFEDTTICCPKEYEKVLDKQYGDWRTPVENGSRHEMVVIDTKTPWKEYCFADI